MSKQAPTTKIDNALHADDNKLYAVRNSTYAFASYDWDWASEDMRYQISYHNGLMPTFDTDVFETIEDLANAMRDFADLRTWTRVYDANGNERI